MVKRAKYGTIGAALLAGAALVAESQTPPPATSAPASATPPAASAAAPPAQPVSQSLGLIVYPAKGQSASQQSVDEQECYNWSKSQKRAQAEQAQDATQSAQSERQAIFQKAMGTCLQGRGYTTG